MVGLVPGHIIVSATGGISAPASFRMQRRSGPGLPARRRFELHQGKPPVRIRRQLDPFHPECVRAASRDGSFAFTDRRPVSDGGFLTAMCPRSPSRGFNTTTSAITTSVCTRRTTGKATPHLSINYGVRWEPYIGGSIPTVMWSTSPSRSLIKTCIRHLSQRPGGVGVSRRPGLQYQQSSVQHTSQRLGSASGRRLDPKGDGRMTIRASWGIFYELPHTLFSYGFSEAPPWGENINRTNVLSTTLGGRTEQQRGIPGRRSFPAQSQQELHVPELRHVHHVSDEYTADLYGAVESQYSEANWRQLALHCQLPGNTTIHLWADAPINAAEYIPATARRDSTA